jgi:hypothetical protein
VLIAGKHIEQAHITGAGKSTLLSIRWGVAAKVYHLPVGYVNLEDYPTESAFLMFPARRLPDQWFSTVDKSQVLM